MNLLQNRTKKFTKTYIVYWKEGLIIMDNPVHYLCKKEQVKNKNISMINELAVILHYYRVDGQMKLFIRCINETSLTVHSVHYYYCKLQNCGRSFSTCCHEN